MFSHLKSFATAVILSALMALAAAMTATAAMAATVGYQELQIPDPTGGTIEIGIWYPADTPAATRDVGPYPLEVAQDAPVSGRHHGLIVMSHGNGGSFASHVDTSLALAQAGFVAAALTHTGDNYRDQSRAIDLSNRPRQLKVLVDYMLDAWVGHGAIDPGKVGAFGFSAGGFTVLALAGGEPDLSTIGPHCMAHPGVYDCQLISRAPTAQRRISEARPTWAHDVRIRAVVSAAPAVGFAFGQAGLAHVTQPLQLWRAEEDQVLPHPDYAEAVRIALPRAPDYHLVPNAGHYDFLPPCNDILKRNAPIICPSRPDFDRAAFHETFNAAVVAFFQAKLIR